MEDAERMSGKRKEVDSESLHRLSSCAVYGGSTVFRGGAKNCGAPKEVRKDERHI